MKKTNGIKIDHNVPVPTVYGKYSKYPFGEMEKGDSFLILNTDETASVRQAASHYANRAGKKIKFSIRKTPDGHRCWRVT